jgi:hypothetical protein
MGVNAGDLSGNGRLDLVVANYEAEINSFYRNVGQGVFEDVSAESGFAGPSFLFSGFGLNLFDAANAGRLDAFIANGHVLDVPGRGSTYAERPFLMWNDGKGRFHEHGCGAPFRRELVGRGSAVADFDNDGDLDIAINTIGGRLVLLENSGALGNWLEVRLEGFAPGTRLTAVLPNGNELVREISAGSSYLSSEDPRAHFGLGTAGTVSTLTVRWPDGQETVTDDVAANQILTLEPPG